MNKINPVPQYLTQTYKTHLENFKEWLQRLGYAKNTVKSYPRKLGIFFKWLASRQIHRLEDISHADLLAFKTHLESCKNQNTGRGLSQNYILGHFNILTLFNRYLRHYDIEPFYKFPISISYQRPSSILFLSQQEIQSLYAATSDSLTGYRDRAILSLLYGCGLRISECLGIRVQDINQAKEIVYVRAGKTHKSRYVPMNKKIQQDLQEYMTYSRPILVGDEKRDGLLISTRHASPLGSSGVNYRLKLLAEQAGIAKQIHAHILRHSIATHLLQEGMELTDIQYFLGHNSIESTERYAQAQFSYTYEVNELTKNNDA